MNVIVYSNRGGRARQFQVDRRLALVGGVSVFLFVIAAVFFAGMRVGGGGFFLTPSSQVLEWSRQLESQRAQVQEVRRPRCSSASTLLQPAWARSTPM
jgi:hypothetical protein